MKEIFEIFFAQPGIVSYTLSNRLAGLYPKYFMKNFIYLSWAKNDNKALEFKRDKYDTVEVTTSVGPYKNVYGDYIFERNEVYYWEIRIIKGTNFKIGVFKISELPNFKGKAFSDSAHGYAYYSNGQLRHESNKSAAGTLEYGQAYGPGDVIGVQFSTKDGTLSFCKNGEALVQAYKNDSFRQGGYVPAVAALLQGSRFSLTLPTRED